MDGGSWAVRVVGEPGPLTPSVRRSDISKTTDQALCLLLMLGGQGPMSTTDLSRAAGMNRTVVHRLLKTLHGRGFVRRDGDAFGLGPVIVALADRVEPGLRRNAVPVLKRMAAQTGETVTLALLDGMEVVVAEQALGERHFVRIQNTLGSRHALHIGASGRVLLAYQSERFVERALRRMEDPDRIQPLLDEIRRQGHATSRNELMEDVQGLAVPVVDRDGHAIACLTMLTPLSRAAVANEALPELKQAADGLARSLERDGL